MATDAGTHDRRKRFNATITERIDAWALDRLGHRGYLGDKTIHNFAPVCGRGFVFDTLHPRNIMISLNFVSKE